jgi:drug/metabolite transporter (DMT)-like permease
MVIAWLAFHENVDRRLLAGAAAIFLGAALLSWNGQEVAPGAGSLLIAAACLAWGIDNNLTRALSNADPVQIALIKGLAAGSVNLVLALATGAHLPSLSVAFYALALGFLGFGVSLVFFVRALRLLGTARTSAYFSTAPFIGAVLAVALNSEPITTRLLLAGVLMAIGVCIHLRESHLHAHTHEALDHEHRHVHDAHHRHDHGATDPSGEPHSHWHRHVPLAHSHSHYPDAHHRHKH